MIILKNVSKRMSALLLAFVMVFLLVPQIPVEVHAADSVTALDGKLTISIQTSSNQASITTSGTQYTATLKPTNPSCGKYTGVKNTILITASEKVTFSFSYVLSNYASFETSWGSDKDSDTKALTLDANSSISITFTGLNENKNATLVLSDFVLSPYMPSILSANQ